MTLRIPNLGTGNGSTGDNELKIREDYNHNFSDESHAASKLVGSAPGNLMAVGTFGLGRKDAEGLNAAGSSIFPTSNNLEAARAVIKNTPVGFFKTIKNGEGFYLGSSSASNLPESAAFCFFVSGYNRSTPSYCYVRGDRGFEEATDIHIFRTTQNTTVDSNGFIKAASPIIKVFSDKIETNSEADDQNVTYTKNDIGDYTITTQSGLSTNGWYLELPLDLNGNPKVAVTLEETNGVISLKCYKRVFDMTTFTFGPDLDNPLDVPDGRWIDIRLNEIEREDVPMPDIDPNKAE